MKDSFTFITDRNNKTSITHRRFKKFKDLENSSFYEEHRPFTTTIGRNFGRVNFSYAYRSLNNAQQQLSQTCGDQINGYVAENIKKFTKKYNEKIILNQGFDPNSTIISLEATTKQKSEPKNIRQMRICQLVHPLQPKTQQVLGQPFFINAKQKLTRMIARKRQMQKQYQTLQAKVKDIERQKLIIRRQKDRKFQNPQHVGKLPWDNQWRAETAKQTTRYRSRLSVKHKKFHSNLTIQW